MSIPNCSTPGCKDIRGDLRYAWIRAFYRDDISELKMVYVCARHLHNKYIDYFHTVHRGDSSFYKAPRGRPKLKPCESLLTSGCPYYSSIPSSGTKRTCFSFDSKEEDLLNQATNFSMRSENEEKEKLLIVYKSCEISYLLLQSILTG